MTRDQIFNEYNRAYQAAHAALQTIENHLVKHDDETVEDRNEGDISEIRLVADKLEAIAKRIDRFYPSHTVKTYTW